jgi:hypothetical protein
VYVHIEWCYFALLECTNALHVCATYIAQFKVLYAYLQSFFLSPGECEGRQGLACHHLHPR